MSALGRYIDPVDPEYPFIRGLLSKFVNPNLLIFIALAKQCSK